jgi:hypothetical protein
MKKAFTQLQQMQEVDSDVSDSEESQAASHFQFEQGSVVTLPSAMKQNYNHFTFTQVDKEFERSVAKLFKQSHGKEPSDLDIRKVILLDSQSTMDLFCNRDLGTKTYRSKKSLTLKSNGGTMVVKQKADVPGYEFPVWFDKTAITNILALSKLIKQYRVTYDSDQKMFVIHRDTAGKTNMEFRMHESVHIYDPKKEALMFITTVLGNKEGFTKRQIKGAEVARTLYATLGYPSWNHFKWVLRSNQIKDCPVRVQDADVAFQIWGKNIAALKGKTTRSKPASVAKDYVKVPLELLNLHREVFLTVDIFFVNKIPFFLTLSRKICFTAVNHLADRTVPQIFAAFKEIYQYYLQRGFRITTVHADGEFEPLKTLIESLPSGPLVNLASSNEHVPEIERHIRVVKERCRATQHGLPFTRIPRLLTIHIVFHVVKLLNFFPTKGGVLEMLSPKTILSGETLDYKKHLRLQVGQYCQVHEEDAPRNSQRPRTKGAIALGPSGNLQGGYKFMALNSGKTIVRRSWGVIPMPDTVIARVNTLGGDQPEDLIFADRHGRLIGDDDTTIPGVAFPDEPADEIPGVDAQVELPGVDADDGAEDPAPPVDDGECHVLNDVLHNYG